VIEFRSEANILSFVYSKRKSERKEKRKKPRFRFEVSFLLLMNYLCPFYLSFIPKNRVKIHFYTQKYGKDRLLSCFFRVYS